MAQLGRNSKGNSGRWVEALGSKGPRVQGRERYENVGETWDPVKKPQVGIG